MNSTTQTAKRPGAGSKTLLLSKLRVLYDGEAGIIRSQPRTISFGENLSIGRGLDEDHGVGLEDASVSRTHASINNQDGQLLLTDHESKNGTFVNGHRVTQAELVDGDIVRVGNSFLIVRNEQLVPPDAEIPSIVGVAPATCALRTALKRLAPTAPPVLILGESGTGKEVAARILHQASGRSGELIAVNCSAIPEGLAESQFFGQVDRAFNEARAHPGYFRAADRGTLFLDEVGDLPAALQPKLLRALEEGQVTPVGSVRPVSCQVRVIAATNHDLERAVTEGQFRGDLYTRLAGLIVKLPPLRSRREDILLLVRHFFEDRPPRMTPELVEALLSHEWRFNIRELQKICEELSVLRPGTAVLDREMIRHRLSPPPAPEAAPAAPSQHARPPRRPRPTKEELAALLTQKQGVIRQVERELGWSAKQIRRWIEEYGLDLNSYRQIE